MSNGDLFYVCGIALAISAVVLSFVGLRSEKFPGRAFPLVILWFAILVGSATTFAVLHAQDEEEAKAAEHAAANREIAQEESDAEAEAPSGGETAEQPAVEGPGGELQLAASPTQIAFDTRKLTSEPGKVTIDFDNPATIEHDVAIEKDGAEIAASPLIANSKTTVSADLAPGTYTFLCTVPGHAEAGMQGTLVVFGEAYASPLRAVR
ncbi:MAG TPA: plastocyanin/azurin family copper-binding protein [Solirubrobacterales bacterium]|nr:plastocyanin/azurin family copper-binding protein [Solirubrobacterales bacterium]